MPARSNESVLFHELANILLVHKVVLVLLPFQGGAIEQLLTQACAGDVLLDLLIIVRESRKLASFPGEHSLVPVVVEGNEEEEAIENNGELVDVSPHRGVRCLHHIII